MHLKFRYGILLLLFISCNTIKNTVTSPEKNNYTFIIRVQKDKPVDPLIQASMRIMNPNDFEIYPAGITLTYDSIEDFKLADIRREIAKCSGILEMKIVKE